MSFLPYGRQDILEEDIDAVTQVLRSDLITQGPKVAEFEQGVAGYCGAQFAVAVNSATSALHLACLALDIGPGDEVWTSPNTFVASANCVRLCGADVNFVDIDHLTYNLCATALAAKLARHRQQGSPLPRAVIVVHFAGQSCDMQAIAKLSDEYDFSIIEDASHAIGARYRGVAIGACQYSDITVFSFHPVKIITTAEGGMATTNSEYLSRRMRLLRTHGVHKPVVDCDDEEAEPWVYEQHDLGLNYRMTDIQAALGLSQLGRLDQYIERRHALARRYDKMLSSMNLVTPYQSEFGASSYHLYPILVGQEADGRTCRRELYKHLTGRGIGVNIHYIPVHTQPYYQRLGHLPGDYPVAESYYSRTLSLPLFGVMTDEEQDRVVICLQELLNVQLAA